MIIAIILVTVLATVGVVVSFGVLVGRKEASVERVLAGYELPDPNAMPAETGGPETAVVQQAVAFTGRMAEKTGLLTKVEAALERGDVPIRAQELMFYTIAGVVAVFLLMALLTSFWVALISAGLAAMAPAMYVSNRQRDRARKFERQLPDTLTLLASSLRAGFSFMQGLEAVAQEIGTPMRRELQRVFTEVRLGRSPEDALGEAAVRMDSTDLAWTVMAIKIQREVGGNLASLLDTVADTMTKRERIRSEVRALTAEGRLSAIVLACLPPLAGLGLFLIAPDYVEALFDETIGIVACIGAACLAFVGWLWLRRIVDIEV